MIPRRLFLWAFATLAGLAPAALWAGPLELRTGDHPGFTRVVVHLDSPRDWQLAQDQDRVQLSIAGQADGFLTDGVFARIGRSRLSDVQEVAPDRVELTLACDCLAKAFLFGDRMLVVDLRARKDDEPIPRDTALLDPAPAAKQDAEASGEIEVVEVVEDQQAPALPPIPLPQITLPLRTSVASTRLVTRMMDTDLDAAVAAGLLAAEAQIRIERADAPPGLVEDPELRPAHAPQDSRSFCPTGIAEATQDWAGDDGFMNGLGHLRSRLFDVTGREARGVRLELARFHVAHGAGVEAIALLEGSQSDDVALVRAMAQTLDRPSRTAPQAFVNCPELAIWEVMRLARQRGEATRAFDDEALILGYRGLSAPLQTLFEDEVLRYLEAHGYQKAATTIAIYRERTHAPQDHVAMIDGAAEALPKQIDETEVLRRVLDRFADLPSAAAASPQERDMVAAFRHEYQDTSWSPDLWQADMRLHLSLADFDAALTLAREGRRAYPQAFEKSYAEMLYHVTDTADDIAFLKIALAIGTGESGLPVPTADVAEHVNNRLRLLGF